MSISPLCHCGMFGQPEKLGCAIKGFVAELR